MNVTTSCEGSATPEIGIRELKTHASEIMRSVRGAAARYVITYRGKPIGLLTPVDELSSESGTPPADDAWDELTQLGEEIAEGWDAPQSSVVLLADMRR